MTMGLLLMANVGVNQQGGDKGDKGDKRCLITSNR